jgi:hypothetical protein
VIKLLGWWIAAAAGVAGLALMQRERWASCPHGQRGGKTQNLCEKCIQEQKDIEEKARRERELQERQERVEVAADDLQHSEQLRLAPLMPNIEELRSLDPRDFENVIAGMFERMGFTVEQTPYVNDHGRDAILRRDGKLFLLECKKYGQATVVGRPDLQKFHSAIITDRAVSGFFVTTGGFCLIAYRPSRTTTHIVRCAENAEKLLPINCERRDRYNAAVGTGSHRRWTLHRSFWLRHAKMAHSCTQRHCRSRAKP